MKFSNAVIALAAASLASAQLPDVPECSLNCFISALTSDGCSGLLDFECHCTKPELPGKITPCVEEACELSDRIAVSDAVVDKCNEVGVPIDIPPIDGGDESSTAETTAEPTAEPTESESAEPTDSTAEPTAEPTETETAEPTESAEPTQSSGTGGSAQPTGTGNLPPPSGTPTGSPEFPGAASTLGIHVGGVAAALLAVAAYL
ncbi:hypothetical protein AJ80_04962 [Polytolypa hystricis UAMH7299]|uniref:CFEM domain-containing protein n=1 Tax=Polytolypa hystricis (strain UAMH7299) TaxID=1447883 RepID=A0A2B7Y7L1_POLH7|nr:hypothetical protein AJ80_04962 [Polytolypa hystricis UAMH7299]